MRTIQINLNFRILKQCYSQFAELQQVVEELHSQNMEEGHLYNLVQGILAVEGIAGQGILAVEGIAGEGILAGLGSLAEKDIQDILVEKDSCLVVKDKLLAVSYKSYINVLSCKMNAKIRGVPCRKLWMHEYICYY